MDVFNYLGIVIRKDRKGKNGCRNPKRKSKLKKLPKNIYACYIFFSSFSIYPLWGVVRLKWWVATDDIIILMLILMKKTTILDVLQWSSIQVMTKRGLNVFCVPSVYYKYLWILTTSSRAYTIENRRWIQAKKYCQIYKGVKIGVDWTYNEKAIKEIIRRKATWIRESRNRNRLITKCGEEVVRSKNKNEVIVSLNRLNLNYIISH